MARLLVLADDFTGALDTGVQFINLGASVKVLISSEALSSFEDADVAVVDSETRHMSPKDAYRTVRDICEKALSSGFSHIYKKTDSGLRGNIGAEFSAAMDAMGKESLKFAPAFPAMNRIVKNGILYIDGVKVEDSVFGKDPFEPVTRSDVKGIIESTTDKDVHLHCAGEEKGIDVYDCVEDSDLKDIVASLSDRDLELTAGCAGFARFIAERLSIGGSIVREQLLGENLLIICGSVNQVSIDQIEYAADSGIPRLTISDEDKFSTEKFNSHIKDMTSKAMDSIRSQGCCIIDVGHADSNSLGENNCRTVVASKLGSLAREILDNGFKGVVMFIGGDTLVSFISTSDIDEIKPVAEVKKGLVLSSIKYKNNKYQLLSKSGGFGDRHLLRNIYNMTVTGGLSNV